MIDNEQLVRRIRAGEGVAVYMLCLWQQNEGFFSILALKYLGFGELEV